MKKEWIKPMKFEDLFMDRLNVEQLEFLLPSHDFRVDALIKIRIKELVAVRKKDSVETQDNKKI